MTPAMRNELLLTAVVLIFAALAAEIGYGIGHYIAEHKPVSVGLASREVPQVECYIRAHKAIRGE